MQISSTFINPKLRYCKKSIMWVCTTIRQISDKVKKWGNLVQILTNYALNIRLMGFSWKFHYICEHRYHNFLAVIVISLHRNNIRFGKKIPIYTPCKHWNMSHHWNCIFTGYLKLLRFVQKASKFLHCAWNCNHMKTCWICSHSNIICDKSTSFHLAAISCTMQEFACPLHKS